MIFQDYCMLLGFAMLTASCKPEYKQLRFEKVPYKNEVRVDTLKGEVVQNCTEKWIVHNYYEDSLAYEQIDSFIYSRVQLAANRYFWHSFRLYKHSKNATIQNFIEDRGEVIDKIMKEDKIFDYLWSRGGRLTKTRFKNGEPIGGWGDIKIEDVE